MGPLAWFYFQAEDGIRAGHVTGVQTCALPISQELYDLLGELRPVFVAGCAFLDEVIQLLGMSASWVDSALQIQIGRASCRERGERWGGAVSCKKNRQWWLAAEVVTERSAQPGT